MDADDRLTDPKYGKQMDVYDVLADIEKNGPGPQHKFVPKKDRPLTAAEVVAKRMKETK